VCMCLRISGGFWQNCGEIPRPPQCNQLILPYADLGTVRPWCTYFHFVGTRTRYGGNWNVDFEFRSVVNYQNFESENIPAGSKVCLVHTNTTLCEIRNGKNIRPCNDPFIVMGLMSHLVTFSSGGRNKMNIDG